MTTQSTIKIAAVAAITALLLSGSQAHAALSPDGAGSTDASRDGAAAGGSGSADIGAGATRADSGGDNGGGYTGPGDTTPGTGTGGTADTGARPFNPGSAGYYRKAPHLHQGANTAIYNYENGQ